MSSSIDFQGDWSRADRGSTLRALAEGRLPGKWGLLQQVVSHWAIPARERGPLRFGKAGLDTVGSVLSYRDAQKKVLDEGTNPCKEWLRTNDYKPAFPGAGDAFLSFVLHSLNGVSFRKQKIRNDLGEASDSALLEFDIAPGKKAYFYDSMGNSKGSAQGPSTDRVSVFWDGPYVQPDDRALVEDFVREVIWRLLGTKTLILTQSKTLLRDESFRLASVSDEFDFISAEDAWNDVCQLASRCKAFLNRGRSRCLLFYGPPGTGKSTVARAIARELENRVLLVDHEAVSRLSSQSTARIIRLLEPGMLVLNDIDRSTDDHSGLLQSLDVAYEDDRPLLTCLTVNDITRLDPALLRPGRIHETRHVPEPRVVTYPAALPLAKRDRAQPFHGVVGRVGQEAQPKLSSVDSGLRWKRRSFGSTSFH